MNKYQILRQIVLAIRAVQNGTAEFYPALVPCTAEEAREALQNVALSRPAQEVEIAINDGWEIEMGEDGWDEEWVKAPEHCGVEIRPMPAIHGPLHVHSREFGVRGLDPWFRQVGEDWAWAVTPF